MSMTELKKKKAPIPQPQIDTIVKALEGAIALPVIFGRSPQDVLDVLAGINVVLSQFIMNLVQKVS
jgi:hypothetical protein